MPSLLYTCPGTKLAPEKKSQCISLHSQPKVIFLQLTLFKMCLKEQNKLQVFLTVEMWEEKQKVFQKEKLKKTE